MTLDGPQVSARTLEGFNGRLVGEDVLERTTRNVRKPKALDQEGSVGLEPSLQHEREIGHGPEHHATRCLGDAALGHGAQLVVYERTIDAKRSQHLADRENELVSEGFLPSCRKQHGEQRSLTHG